MENNFHFNAYCFSRGRSSGLENGLNDLSRETGFYESGPLRGQATVSKLQMRVNSQEQRYQEMRTGVMLTTPNTSHPVQTELDV